MVRNLTKKLLSLSLLALIILALALSFVSPVLAIADPDTISIDSITVYRNVSANGDMLFFIEYYCHYATLPTETVTDAFKIELYDTDGTTPLGHTHPFAYYRKGYDRGYAAIYFTAAEVTASLTWGADYSVKMLGIVPPFTTAPESDARDIDTWSANTSSIEVHKEFAGKIINAAYVLSHSWNIPSDQSLLTPTTDAYGVSYGATYYAAGATLSLYGMAYFTHVVPDPPGLKTAAPYALQSYTSEPEDFKIDYQGRNYDVYNTGTATFTKGSTTVTGSGTVWTEAMEGRDIKPFMVGTTPIDGDEKGWYRITDVADGTTLTISSAYPYSTKTGAIYVIGTTHEKSLTVNVLHNPLDMSDLADQWGISVNWLSGILVLGLIGVLDAWLISKTDSHKGITFIDGVICCLAAAGGLFTLTGAIAFAVAGVLLLLYTMFYNKATA